MNDQSVEAIVVEYRSPDRTIACVSSLLQQPVDRIHIIDNSSDSGTTSSILKHAFQSEHRVNIVDAMLNKGFAAAVNMGLQLCTSTFALIINNDAVPEPDAIEVLRSNLANNRRAIASFPALLHSGQPLNRVFYHTWFATITSMKLPGSYEVPRGCCMLIARERLDKPQLFDEQFFMYGEELELGWRFRNQPGAFIWVKEARVIHEGSASSVRGSPFYEERTALAHLLLGTVLCKPGMLGTLHRATRLSALFVRAAIRSLRQRSTLPLHSFRSAKRHAADSKNHLSSPGTR